MFGVFDLDSLLSPPGKFTRNLLCRLLRPVPPRAGILMITRSDLFPPDHGAAVRIDRAAWGISRLAGPVYLVTDERAHFHRYVDGVREVVSFPRWLARVGPWRRALRRRLRRSGIPVQDIFLYCALMDWNLWLRASYVAARHGLRVFHAVYPAYALVSLRVRSVLGGGTSLEEHNVEFERLREQIGDLTPRGYDLLRDVEIRLCNQVDMVIAVSNRDRDILVRHGVDPARLQVIPHGVDVSSFDSSEVPRSLLQELGIAPSRPVLVYHGTYLYPPNLEAMQALADEILPRLYARGLQPVVLAIGPNPPEERLHPDIYFVGSVDSVAPYIKAADIAVVPLRQGCGTRMKVLDYFAATIPVVSTSKGVEGLELVDGAQLLIRDGDDAFAEAIASLLNDKDRARALGSAGRKYAEQFDWPNIASRYVELLRSSAQNTPDLERSDPA